ncbi:LysR family transcriptional regulator for bpeEF and oprC [Luteibacter sp. HA06]
MDSDTLENMQLFLRVADTGSFSRGARGMGLSQSTASRNISRMEARLGAQLLRRTTRGMSLTEAGQEYYEAILRLMAGIDAAEAGFTGALAGPSGLLRVALSAALGRAYILRHLDEFLDLYPDVDIEFEIAERRVDLVAEGIDVAIRVGAVVDSKLVARQLGTTGCVTVATPGYIFEYGTPRHPMQVRDMPCVVFTSDGGAHPWRFEGAEEDFSIPAKAVLRTNDAEQIRSAVLGGIGMGQGPAYLYADALASGELVEVLGEFAAQPAPITAVSPAGRKAPRRVQVFVDFVAEKFGANACGAAG